MVIHDRNQPASQLTEAGLARLDRPRSRSGERPELATWVHAKGRALGPLSKRHPLGRSAYTGFTGPVLGVAVVSVESTGQTRSCSRARFGVLSAGRRQRQLRWCFG